MTIDWAALALVACATVVAALAIVGLFSLGVVALTAGRSDPHDEGAVARPTPHLQTVAGYACMAMSGLFVVYGLYLIIPQFH